MPLTTTNFAAGDFRGGRGSGCWRSEKGVLSPDHEGAAGSQIRNVSLLWGVQTYLVFEQGKYFLTLFHLHSPRTSLKYILFIFLSTVGLCSMLSGCLYLVPADLWGLRLVPPHRAHLRSRHIQSYHCGAQLPRGALQKAFEKGSNTGWPERTHAWCGKVWNNHLWFLFNKFW